MNDCPINLYRDLTRSICADNCSSPAILNDFDRFCNNTCPEPYFADMNNLSCVTNCSSNLFIFM